MEAQLTVEEGGSGGCVSLVPGQSCVIGRAPEAGLSLNDAAVAPHQVRVEFEGPDLRVVDLGSGATTRVNEQPLAARGVAACFPGDALRLGQHVIRVTLLGRGVRTRRRVPDRRVDAAVPEEEFELLRVLGQGAAGIVYAARWKPHDRLVAIKVLRDRVLPGSSDHARFLRECETVARLQSPYVVAVYDLRTAGDRAYCVMELVEGPSARDALTRGPYPIHYALRVAEDVALALAAAAEAGVVHRDVKPANILLSPQGVAKLCDFGIAKDLESSVLSLTASGLGLGTMAYLPPEQVSEAKHVEPSADVYALGATLYHLIAGCPPFAPTSAATLMAVLHQDPPPLTHWRPDCPPQLAQAVHAMMAKDADDRPPLWRVTGHLKALRESLYPGLETDGLFAR